MNKTNQHSFSSVISINPYAKTYFSGISSFLTETTSPQYAKNQFVISYLNTNGFITSRIEITKNIPEEDLYDAINSKVYDELGLDQAITYQVQFIETFNSLDAENRHFQVFIVDPINIAEIFEETVQKIKYIDLIIPVPLLLKSLYVKEIIQNSGAHCFVYFQQNDAFITFYYDKEFVYTKSLKYSFIQMHERFCELYGERVEYEEFIDFLANHNLRETTSDFKEHLIKLYKEIFANINDIVTFVKRAFEIDKTEHLYIGSQIYTLSKLDEMAEAELGIKSSNFEFDYGFESEGTYIDQIHALMHTYTALPEEEKYECNFTSYPRPPKFQQRVSGKIIMVVAASLLLAFMYPVTYWVLTYAQTLQHDLLDKEYRELHLIKTTREATINNREADKAKAVALLTKEEKEYNEKKATLIKIHDVKVNYPMKSKLLAQLTKDLNYYDVKVETWSYSEANETKNFTLDLVSSSDKQITQLIEYLTKVYENKFNFFLEDISYNKENKKYFSELKVKIL